MDKPRNNRFKNTLSKNLPLSLLLVSVAGFLIGAAIWRFSLVKTFNYKPTNQASTEVQADEESSPQNIDKQIQDLQNEILLNARSDYEVHVKLAELYVKKGDLKSAIQSYEFAKKAVDPKDQQYETVISSINAAVAKLEQR